MGVGSFIFIGSRILSLFQQFMFSDGMREFKELLRGLQRF